MFNFNSFIKRIFLVEMLAIIALYFAGAMLSWVEYGHGASFFTYRLRHLNYLPAWFISTLILMIINGISLFKLGAIEGSVIIPGSKGTKKVDANIPINSIRLLGINLIAIPGILIIFIIARANYW